MLMKLFTYIAAFCMFISGVANAVELFDRDVANEKLSPILTVLKEGIKKHDVSIFEKYVLFPLNISYEEQYVAADGTVKLRTEKIQTASELQQRFDDVFTPTVVRLIDCMTPEKMMYNKYKGFAAASGGIWFLDVFSKDTRERMFVLSSISTNKTVTENWIKLNCEEASNKVIHPTSKSGAAGSDRDKQGLLGHN